MKRNLELSGVVCPTRSCTASDVTVRFTLISYTASDKAHLGPHCNVASSTASGRAEDPDDHNSFHPCSCAREWASVAALVVVSVLHASNVKASGLATNLPLFPTILVLAQVASFAFLPSRGRFPAILARNALPCSSYVPFGIVAAFEMFVAAGAAVTPVVLLERHSSCARSLDQDTRVTKVGGLGRHGSVGRGREAIIGVVVVLRRMRNGSVALRRERGGV